jgi:uncharacterized glyoxalase superfamily protein PhnB
MNTAQVKPIPDGMHGFIPHLVCAGAADAIAFYQKAFGAVELTRLPGPGGKLLHASMRVGESVFMLNDENPAWCALGPKTLKGTPVTLHLYVEDVDAAARRAVDAGAKVVMEVADMFWGDRYGVFEDPFGHRWSLASHLRDMSTEEMQQAMQAMAG